MKLTFIVPLYNAEKFISACLDSILNTDLDKSDFEVVVINDGSVDRGPTIAEDYAKRYDNIRVYHQVNQGLSVARNHGMREAKGKYIWFVDSDDYVDATNILPILQMLDERQIQVCKFDMIVYKGNAKVRSCDFPKLRENKCYTGEDVLLSGGVMGSVCNAFYSRRFFADNNLWFYPGIIHQDSEFSIRCASVTKSQIYLRKPLYFYRYNTTSSTKSRQYERVLMSYISDVIIAHNIREYTSKYVGMSNSMRTYLDEYPTAIMTGRLLSFLRMKDKFSLRIFDEVIRKSEELGEYPLRYNKKSLKKAIIASVLNNKRLLRFLVKIRNN